MTKLSYTILGMLSICSAAEASSPCEMSDLVNASLESLMEVTASSSNKTVTCINQAPSTINSYSYKDLQRLSARKLSDLLWTVAGFQVQVVPNGRERAWVRGVQSEFNHKVSLYVDNVPVKNVFGGFDIDEEIPVESIEKIEIIRGPGSALYGANAFSGVINIFTFQGGEKKDLKARTTKNIVKGIVGEQNTYAGYFSVQQNIADAIDVVLEGKGLISDGRKPDYNRVGEPNTRSAAHDLGYLHLNLAALEGELQFNATYSRYNNEREDVPVPRENNRIAKSFRFSLAYKHQFNDDFGIDLLAYHTNTHRIEHETDYLLDKNKQITGTDYAIKFIGETDLSGFYAATNYKPHESNQLVAGFEYKREASLKTDWEDKLTGFQDTALSNSDYVSFALNSYSLFLQDTQNIIDNKTQFTVGLRYDFLDLFKNQFSYRLGLTHAFTDTIFSKLLYGTAYRSPSFVEYIFTKQGAAIPDVETMKTLEAQIGYQDKKTRVSLTGYWNRYNNFIDRNNSFNSNSGYLLNNEFSNLDNLEIFGAELEANVAITENWSGFLNASANHARSKNEKQKLPLLADWTVTTGIEWKDEFDFGDLSFNNRWIIYGKRRDWPTTIWKPGVEQRYANRDSGLTDGFAVWNTSLHYKLPLQAKEAIDLDLSVFNLLDKKYYTQSLTPPANKSRAYFDTQYEGRQLRFSVSYSW